MKRAEADTDLSSTAGNTADGTCRQTFYSYRVMHLFMHFISIRCLKETEGEILAGFQSFRCAVESSLFYLNSPLSKNLH